MGGPHLHPLCMCVSKRNVYFTAEYTLPLRLHLTVILKLLDFLFSPLANVVSARQLSGTVYKRNFFQHGFYSKLSMVRWKL